MQGLLFRKMFLKCEDAKRYGCRCTKTTTIVREMVANAENTMVEAVKRRAFAIAVDASNDSGSQMYPIIKRRKPTALSAGTGEATS